MGVVHFGAVMRDGTLLAVGTLTRLPVPPPHQVDRRTAGIAMSLAPLVGLLLAVSIGVPLAGLDWVLPATQAPLAAILIALLVISGLAWLTRGLHLDGLADFADALGSGKPAEQALAIARRPDIGPFGTSTLILVILLQSIALGLAIERGLGIAALVTALIASRLGLTWACTPRWRPARPDGLGATVAGSTSALVAVLITVTVTALAVTCAWFLGGNPGSALMPVAGVVAALLTTWIICRMASARLGGITGDVLGAAVETSSAASLVAMALVAVSN